MLDQMLHIIDGMKDTNKLGRLQGAVISRICEIAGTDPVAHLNNLAQEISVRLTHEEAERYAERVLSPMELGAETFDSIRDKRQARRQFARRYPNWRPNDSAALTHDRRAQ
jgi:hypothetical protein